MKASLWFDLDEHFDRQEHMRAVKATDAYRALSDIADYFRQAVDQEDPPALDVIRSKFWEILEDAGIDLNSEYS